MPSPADRRPRVLRPVPRPDAESGDEIAFHLDERTRELIAAGLAPDAARAEALRAFGNVGAVRSELATLNAAEHRRASLRDAMDDARRDLGFALRTLRREPSLVAGILSTLALAIGANAAMFGVVSQLLLAAPPGFASPERVARVRVVRTADDGEAYAMSTVSFPTYRALRQQTQSFERVAAARRDSVFMGSDASASPVATLGVSGEYFALAGAQARLGRLLTPTDDELPDGQPVVVLGNAFWQRQFLGRTDVLGERIVLGGQPFTVVGVAQRGFTGDDGAPVDLFVPLSASLRATVGWRDNAHLNAMTVIARLRAGTDADAAATLATQGMRRADAPGNDFASGIELESIVPGRTARRSPQGRIALWLAGVSMIVLLIATANVATLLLLRAVKRRREIAVRIALGAGRARLARQLLAESIVLAIGGGVAGLVLERWLSSVLRATLLPNLAGSETLIDSRTTLAAAAFTVFVGIAAGLAPMMQLMKPRIASELHGGDAAGAVEGARAQRLLVGLQVAMCTVLLFGAGLFVRSLDRISSQDLGFTTRGVVFARLEFRANLGGADRDAAYHDAARRLRQLPGIRAATVVAAMPFGFHNVPPIDAPGRTAALQAGQLPMMYGATPAYLDLLGVRVLEGRALTDADGRNTRLVVLVNRSMARTVWPGESALGKCIRIGFDPSAGPPTPVASPSLPCREIVGVVADSRARSIQPTGNEASLMQYYVPFDQLPALPFAGAAQVNGLLIGTTADEEAAIASIRGRCNPTRMRRPMRGFARTRTSSIRNCAPGDSAPRSSPCSARWPS